MNTEFASNELNVRVNVKVDVDGQIESWRPTLP